MAAYAALLSVMHILRDIGNHHRPPISIVDEHFESLIENVTFLQQFLEDYSNNDIADALESRIAGAAYAAEDVIESHIVDRIQAAHSKGIPYGKNMMTFVDFCHDLQKVIRDLDSIKRDVQAEMRRIQDDDNDGQLLLRYDPLQGDSSSLGQNPGVVGLDDVLIQAIDKLTGEQSSRQVFSIVGMGGIGKTTLARIVYEHPAIVKHFDILAWATISQGYNPKQILLGIIVCIKNITGSRESLSQMSEQELGVILHKSLSSRRYLIVMDDIWSIEAWDQMSVYFPDYGNRSRVLITTRMSNLASELSGSCGEHSLVMPFLDEDKSWDLFRKSAFGEKRFPRELKGTGKRIAKICKGLPLSIVVIGGLLSKSKQTPEYWLQIARNLTSVVNLDDNERCLKILRLSYNQLPVHLKPCYLYLGGYPVGTEIHVSNLMNLWVAEGFIKPVSGKWMEVVAREYVNELTDRNLVLVSKRGNSGNIKCCRIHDLLMDLCVREAQNHDFLCVLGNLICSNNPQVINNQRRIVVNEGMGTEVFPTLTSASLVRSFTHGGCGNLPTRSTFRLLRVLNGNNKRSSKTILFSLKSGGLLNCRYLDHLDAKDLFLSLESSISHLWNLQTLIVSSWEYTIMTSVIWKMPQLRHVESYYDLILMDPPISHQLDDGRDDFVILENLHTISGVKNFKFSEDVVKRIPNVRKLKISYKEGIKDWSSCCLNNLVLLLELESLSCRVDFQKEPSPPSDMLDWTLPRSLKKLTLCGTKLQWENMATNIGSLPHLLVLKLKTDSFIGSEWETVEGQFCSLKYLEISGCCDLVYWRTESSHFPCLEHLFLIGLDKLEEIPPEIGEIPTMKSIELYHCSNSTIVSADEIVKEQIENYGIEGLQVNVVLEEKNQALESLVSPNFKIEIR